ncbi:hypothetical protein [Streptomyces sp. NBC_00122]|uniref:hypothetical protein n=1 Tax=Streptomyces sp. NBC_00122 TaxID=2903623 RepID=UPI002F90F753
MVGADRPAVDDLTVAGALEEFVGAGHQAGGADVEALGEFGQDADGEVGEFFWIYLLPWSTPRLPWRPSTSTYRRAGHRPSRGRTKSTDLAAASTGQRHGAAPPATALAAAVLPGQAARDGGSRYGGTAGHSACRLPGLLSCQGLPMGDQDPGVLEYS